MSKHVAKVLLFDRDQHVLILRRSETHPYFPHETDYPGGEIEKGESGPDGVRRELIEETGIEIPVEQFQLVHKKYYKFLGRKHYVYRVDLEDQAPEVAISWEHESYHWVHPRDLLTDPVWQGSDSYISLVNEYLSR